MFPISYRFVWLTKLYLNFWNKQEGVDRRVGGIKGHRTLLQHRRELTLDDVSSSILPNEVNKYENISFTLSLGSI